MSSEYVTKRAQIKVLIMHLEGFGNLDGIEVPPWVRPAVKQWLAAGFPNRALDHLKGQLEFYEKMKGDVTKVQLLEAMGLTKEDIREAGKK